MNFFHVYLIPLLLIVQCESICKKYEVESTSNGRMKETWSPSMKTHHHSWVMPVEYEYTVCENETVKSGTVLIAFKGSFKYVTHVNSSIEKIPTNVFQNFANISAFFLNGSNTPTIQSYGVYSAKNLTTLVLYANVITVLFNSTLSDLLNIKSLDLLSTNNKTWRRTKVNVTDSQTEYFEWLFFANIHNVDVSNNMESTRIRQSVMYSNSEENNANHSKSSIFAFSKHLLEVKLSDNKIEHLKQQAFNGLANLESLHLQNNRLNLLPKAGFQKSASLETLSLSNSNNKADLSNKTLATLTSLKKLLFSNDNKSIIHKNPFGVVKSLQELSLNNGSVKSIDALVLLLLLGHLKTLGDQNDNLNCESLFDVLHNSTLLNSNSISFGNDENIPTTVKTDDIHTEGLFLKYLNRYTSKPSYEKFLQDLEGNDVVTVPNPSIIKNVDTGTLTISFGVSITIIGLLILIVILLFVLVMCFYRKGIIALSNNTP
ncbi:hypothetical protein FQA39_LY12725 [Lamprigera yunnana]|nr:hypothetical protein FQA39_LY12725 [Lamprigera yunnana]